MAWIKRNLWFLVGAVIALILLGVSGGYLFTQNKANNDIQQQLTQGYQNLNGLLQENPNAGNDRVDNIKAAKEQQKQWQQEMAKAGKFFAPIDPIPPAQGTNAITDQQFASALRQTIDQLQRDAQAASVLLPPQYDFSFGAIKSRITFASGSLSPLSTQLGEIKTLCGILFQAKINSLDSLRRSRVSADDVEVADYTDDASVTNDLAVLTPYEISFRCFSTELAGVISGLADSTHCFIVKTATVEPAGAADAAGGATPNPAAPAAMAPVLQRGGLPTVINEHPLKVTLLVELVKLKPAGK